MKEENGVASIPAQTDIYLIDQILKNRYNPGETILDAGCGSGRNIEWFIQNNFTSYGIDISIDVISQIKEKYQHLPSERFLVSTVDSISFADNFFDHIICVAVLHFAENKAQFLNMLKELLRVLKRGGSLLIRIASDIGIETRVIPVGNGVYFIPDGTKRFLLTRELLQDCFENPGLSFAEPFKTVNVDDTRCMSTLVLIKN